MIKSATAKAGIASVSHRPIEKNNKKNTYTCESVNVGSLTNQVNTNAITNDAKKEMSDLYLFFFGMVTVSFILIAYAMVTDREYPVALKLRFIHALFS